MKHKWKGEVNRGIYRNQICFFWVFLIIFLCIQWQISAKIIHVFISTYLDYCDSLFTGLNENELDQGVQNSAAKLLTNTRKREHITPILASLHCFISEFIIKILVLTFRALSAHGPAYISNLFKLHTPRQSKPDLSGSGSQMVECT